LHGSEPAGVDEPGGTHEYVSHDCIFAGEVVPHLSRLSP
jgi:hypothetical protein